MKLGDAHLGYCTNVVAADNAAELLAALRIPGRVRELLGVPSLGIGLYVSARAVVELDPGWLRDQLAEYGLYVFTLNGFPYGDFHAEQVKQRVYRPDWSEYDRVEYTLALAVLLGEIAPRELAQPTISTVPLGWRGDFGPYSVDTAVKHLAGLVESVAKHEEMGGRPIRICLEPEPGCVLERTEQLIQFFHGPLARALPRESISRYLGICYDTCHQAVAFESPERVLESLISAEIPIGKVQLSSALELADPGDDGARAELAGFAELRYLHQVRAGVAGQPVAGDEYGADDLPEAIARLPRDRAWRTHFHVPIYRDRFGALGTTRAELERAIVLLQRSKATSQYEVETYTWSVLPPSERPHDDETLAAGLARELAWARGKLT
jgi:sugar phosphate isomerase/epimerase